MTAAKLPKLPRELALMTPAQVDAVLYFYGQLGLPELRGRQGLIRKQQAAALAMPEGKAKNRAFSNLAVDEHLLAEAVWRSQWPDEPHSIDVSRWLSD